MLINLYHTNFPTTLNLSSGGGVCGAIFYAAGEMCLQDACDKLHGCETGNVKITPAFNIKNAKYIIHAVGPTYSSYDQKTAKEKLYSAYRRSLEVMIENGCKSIAFPLISAGIYGYSKIEAFETAIEACNDFIKTHNDIKVYFAVIDDKTFEIGKSIITTKSL